MIAVVATIKAHLVHKIGNRVERGLKLCLARENFGLLQLTGGDVGEYRHHAVDGRQPLGHPNDSTIGKLMIAPRV